MKQFVSLCSVWLAEWDWIDYHADWREWTLAFSRSVSYCSLITLQTCKSQLSLGFNVGLFKNSDVLNRGRKFTKYGFSSNKIWFKLVLRHILKAFLKTKKDDNNISVFTRAQYRFFIISMCCNYVLWHFKCSISLKQDGFWLAVNVFISQQMEKIFLNVIPTISPVFLWLSGRALR